MDISAPPAHGFLHRMSTSIVCLCQYSHRDCKLHFSVRRVIALVVSFYLVTAVSWRLRYSSIEFS